LLLEVVFNKERGNLSILIDNADKFSEEKIEKLAIETQKRIIEEYSWKKIVTDYEALFLNA
jgi:rhamnosyltransferase